MCTHDDDFSWPLRRSPATERGQAAVEFTVALPLLLLLLFGIVQFGLMIATYMDLTSATRDAARYAVNARHDSDPVASVRNVFDTSADRVKPEDVDVRVTGGWKPDDDVTVDAKLPYDLDVMGIVVWHGDLRARSVVKIG